MSPEKVQKDWNKWSEVLEKVKINGTTDIDTGHEEDGFSLGLEELCLTLMKIFQTYLRLGLKEEEELISNNFEAIEEVINASPNETVVNYFNERIDKYLEEQEINDLRYMLDA